MAFGHEFSEKLTHLIAATVVCGTTATVAPGLGVQGFGLLALVEALLGAAVLGHAVVCQRFSKADALLRRCTGEVESGSDALLTTEFRDDPDAWARRDQAIVAIRKVVPLIVPKAEELVAARLTENRVAVFYLKRAATVRPGDFADEKENSIARRLFQDVVVNAYRLIVKQPEFAAEMLRHTLADLLQGQDDIRGDVAELAAADERRHRELLEAIARRVGVDPKVLAPLFDHLGQSNLTLDEMRSRAGEAIEAILSRARQKTEPSNKGADIDATIGAARARLENLDTAGARSVLAAKIAEEELAHRQRLVPLLEERAAIERLSYDHEAAKATLLQLLALDPERVWSWIDLGDLFVTTAALDEAVEAYGHGLAIADRLAKADFGNAGWQRELSVSHNKIGDVQVEQGNLQAALTSYQASHYIFDRLANADPGNAEWQRDLSVSHNKIGDVQRAQGDLLAALTSYRASLATADRLAKSDPGNVWWQRDVSVSQGNIGDVQVEQGNLASALMSYQASHDIFDRLAKADLGNVGWQRDLSVSHNKIGDVQRVQGDLPVARATYQASLAIADRLAKADPGNARWQRDLSVSHNKIGDVQVEQGNLPAALTSYQASHDIFDRLAKADPGNAGWQRDLALSFGRVATVKARQGARENALGAFRQGRDIIVRLMRHSPDNASLPRDLAWFNSHIASHEGPDPTFVPADAM